MSNKKTHITTNHVVSLQPLLLTRTLLLYCGCFTLLAWLCLPNMHHDMLENYAWGQTLEWGSFKHPPLFAWITRWWFTLWPTTTAAYYALSYLNDGMALVGILCLAKLLIQTGVGNKPNKIQLQIFLFLVLVFSLLSWPYTIYASRFNADTILLSIWPWTTFAFFSSLETSDTTKKWLWTIALAILAAASLLSKYFSGVLLLTLLITSLIDNRYRRWYSTPFPYVCLSLFILLLTPHVLWEYQMNFPFQSYMSEYISSSTTNNKVLKYCIDLLNFVLSGAYYFLFSWVLWFVLRRADTNSEHKIILSPIPQRHIYSLCFLPVTIVIIIACISGSRLIERWATPIWFALPILMANLLINQLDAIKSRLISLIRAVKLFWLIVFIFIISSALSVSFFKGDRDNGFSLYEAREEMASAIAYHFKTRYPGKTLGWVGGESWPKHAPALAFYITNHPRAIPKFPDEMPALVNPHNTWAEEYGVILCGKDISRKTYPVQDCINQAQLWLKSKQLPIYEEKIAYHASGWRYAKSIEKEVVVFWLPPSSLRESTG